MAGISIGFAVWGSVRPEPDLWQGAESMLAESSRPVSETKQQLSLHSLSAVLMDADSGRILYGKDEHQVRPMASTTKIMTCILALELGNPEDFCEISEKAAGQPKVKLGAPAGSRIRLKDLLYSLMLESHNDSAVAIAEHISGSVEAFTEKMNRKAQDIGCVDTTFLTSNLITTSLDNVQNGDTITVNILGSKSLLLRAGTGEVVYEDPDIVPETEDPTEIPETSATEMKNTETENSEMKSSETESSEMKNTETESSETGSSETTSKADSSAVTSEAASDSNN